MVHLLPSSSRDSITKYHTLGGLNNRKFFFLTILETGNPRSKCQQGWLLLRRLSLAFLHIPGDFALVRLKLTLMTSFNLSYLFKCLISRYSHSGGLSLHHVNITGGRGTVQFKTGKIKGRSPFL